MHFSVREKPSQTKNAFYMDSVLRERGEGGVGRHDFFKTFWCTCFSVSVTKRNCPVCMGDRKPPLLGAKTKSAPRCFRNINNNAKHSAQFAIPIFNPLRHFWAISASHRGQNGNFGSKVPSWQVEDYCKYFELAGNPPKSGQHLN